MKHKTARQKTANRVRGSGARARRGKEKRQAALQAGLVARAKGRKGSTPPPPPPPKASPKDLERRARKILEDLRCTENALTLAEAKHYVQLLDAVDRAALEAAGDGRTLGAMGTASKQATAVLSQLRQLAEQFRLLHGDGEAPAATISAPTSARGKKAAAVPETPKDEWGMPIQ